jgi:cysteine protease ATG4
MDCGFAVSVAIDGTLYQTHVFATSHDGMTVRSRKQHAGHSTTTWGHKPVLLLLGIRLGIDGVNPIYYETIKVTFLLLWSFYLDSSSIILNSFVIPSLSRSG